jgi:hypothetical protein
MYEGERLQELYHEPLHVLEIKKKIKLMISQICPFLSPPAQTIPESYMCMSLWQYVEHTYSAIELSHFTPF